LIEKELTPCCSLELKKYYKINTINIGKKNCISIIIIIVIYLTNFKMPDFIVHFEAR